VIETPTPFAERVGFVGLGHMGRPMACRLLAAGVPLALFDARPDAVDRVVSEAGGAPAASLLELARQSDVVITMLPDSIAVRAVIVGNDAGPPDRLLDALRPGSVLIDMGSSVPTETQALGRILAARGVAMLDAPVSGGVARAVSGGLSIMIGGEAAVIARCRPLLDVLGRQLFEVGSLGAGHALKALNNLASAAGLAVAAEALLIGRRFGLDARRMLDVFNASSARNNSTETKFAQFVFSRSFASGFSLDLMVKDLATALDLADATATPAPLSVACRDLWTAAQADLGRGADHTAIVRWLEELAGTRLEP
jgi:3-hydroxyisobutyrate dehydrogenase